MNVLPSDTRISAVTAKRQAETGVEDQADRGRNAGARMSRSLVRQQAGGDVS